MNKTQLIDAMSSKSGLSKKDTALALDAFTQTVTETLSKKESVSLIGFGTFSTSDRAAREGRNPSTGDVIQIAATTIAKFKVGAVLKNSIRDAN